MKFLLQAILLSPLLIGALPAPDAAEVEQVKGEKIPNAYLVALRESTADAQGLGSHLSWLDSVTKEVTALAGRTQTYDISSFRGYAGEFDDETVALIKARPEVESVEQDAIVQMATTCKNQPYTNTGLWGLGRISHREVGPWMEHYYYDSLPYCSNESNVTAYVIDTGIYTGHDEFGGRASNFWRSSIAKNDDDNCGHGTQVASKLGGATYGVAKNATILSLKVGEVVNGDCIGTWSGVVGAVVEAFIDATLKGTKSKSVINMSISGPRLNIVDQAVNAAVVGGLTVVVAAGNQGADACDYSPGSVERAITVGASSIMDTIPDWSSTGCCVDIFAPGAGVLSAYIGSPNATRISSGTSLSSPHVAGLVLYLKCLYGHNTPAKDKAAVVKHATMGKLTGRFRAGGCSAPNALAYNGACNV